jgi:hypothetical protein
MPHLSLLTVVTDVLAIVAAVLAIIQFCWRR